MSTHILNFTILAKTAQGTEVVLNDKTGVTIQHQRIILQEVLLSSREGRHN